MHLRRRVCHCRRCKRNTVEEIAGHSPGISSQSQKEISRVNCFKPCRPSPTFELQSSWPAQQQNLPSSRVVASLRLELESPKPQKISRKRSEQLRSLLGVQPMATPDPDLISHQRQQVRTSQSYNPINHLDRLPRMLLDHPHPSSMPLLQYPHSSACLDHRRIQSHRAPLT